MDTSNSEFDLRFIERIVREVVKRLTGPAVNGITNKNRENESSQVAEPGEWKLQQRVISLDSITGKLNNVSCLRLPAKAVVTPAARDELRSRNVEIHFDLEKPNNFAGRQLMVGITGELMKNDFANQLQGTGIQTEWYQDERLSRLVAKLAGRVSSIRRGLVITAEPYTAVCVANRNANVRAAIVRDDTELRSAKAEINPNVLVLPVERLKFLPIETAARSLIE